MYVIKDNVIKLSVRGLVEFICRSGDIDILIPDKLQFDKAVSVLELHGVVIMGEQHAWHHVEMHNETGVIIELHRALAEQFDDDDVNKKIEQYTEEMSVHNILKNIDGMNIVCPVLTFLPSGLLLLSASPEDFFRT